MVETVREIKIKTLKYEFACEECFHDLNLTIVCNYTGNYKTPFFSPGTLYEYKCPRCENEFWEEKIYPYTEFVECES
jgi:hypothetical protein